MEPRKRQHGLDGIKLLGMYLVILYHVVFPHMPDVVDAPTAVGYLRYFLETFLGPNLRQQISYCKQTTPPSRQFF